MSMIAVGAASLVPDHPNVWTDGSLVLDRVTGVSSCWSWVFCTSRLMTTGSDRRWGHVDQCSP